MNSTLKLCFEQLVLGCYNNFHEEGVPLAKASVSTHHAVAWMTTWK